MTSRRDEPVVTTTMFSEAEQAAWAVAVERRLPVEAADVRALVAPVIAAERDRCIRLAVEHGAVYFAEPRPCTCKPGCAQVVSRVPFAPLLGGES
jgi:hypothetical protein